MSAKITKAKLSSKSSSHVRKSNPKPKKSKDDARKVAFASDGKLDTDQVRVLRCIAMRNGTYMREIKSYIGLAPDEKYSGKFLDGIHRLTSSKMIRVEVEQSSRRHVYYILDKGRKALKDAVAAEKVYAKHKADSGK